VRRRWAILFVVYGLGGSLTNGLPLAQATAIASQLDRYLRGEFDAVAAELAARKDFDDALDDLKRAGPAWIAAATREDRPRRELTAATVALEAARAADNSDWKWVQQLRLDGPYRPPPAIHWKSPPLLIEWGCSLLRNGSVASEVERIWQLAAVSVAERRSDFEFLIGSPWEERGEPKDEILHLSHTVPRFPKEMRFVLAEAIAFEWRTWPSRDPTWNPNKLPDLERVFGDLSKDPTVGAEASLRLGYVRARNGKFDDALESFARVEAMTRDFYLVYLARYFTGLVRERQNRLPDAERAYRGALGVIPHVGSATAALATLLFKADRRLESSQLIEDSLAAKPQPVDPWRTYAAADDRFWPQLIARLRAEIRR
jgi:tetratricopeptide (TPR) repeat protein